MQCVIYTRVSTDSQVDGISLAAQLAKLQAWASLHDAEIVGTFTDEGISGTREDRPGLLAALETACKHRASLVVYSLSRLSRSTSHTIKLAERLNKSQADLVSLTEQLDTRSASGRMVFRLLATLAEFERDLTAERTKSALAHKRSKNELVGSVPFGFDLAADGISLIENADQQRALELITSLRAKGLSLRTIAAELTRLKVPTAKGNLAWKHSTVQRILERKAS